MFSRELSDLIAKEFPYPFARAMREFGKDPSSKDHCCEALQWTIESMGCFLLADFASSPERSTALAERVARSVGDTLSLGEWAEWIFGILENQRDAGRQPFVTCFANLLEWRSRKTLKRLIRARNDHTHRKRPVNVERFHEDLESLYRLIQPLSRYSLLNPHKDRTSGPLRVVLSELLKGHSSRFQEIDVRTDVPLEFERLYLHAPDSRELLALDPWLTYKPCEPCAKRHFFKVDKIAEGRVEYSAIPPADHPEQCGAAFARFREILAGKTVERLKPRHISLPGEIAALPRSLRPGDRIGPYEVTAILHLGGLSQVYEARDTRSGEHHALKVLPFELSRDMLLLRRFEDELRSIQKLSHPNVIRLIDSGKDQEDRYIVVELARGGRICGTNCRDLSDARKPLPEKSITDLARQVLGALAYIHGQGIIHRDLKPANLLVMGDRIVLTDFGIAWETGEQRYTLTGTIVGTPEYMAPEQVRGGKVDARTDLYALGCILYEMATGRPPYRGRDPFGTANSHVQATPMRIQDLNPRISRGLANIIMKLLQKSPQLRYQSAAELLEHLGKVGDDPAGAQVIEGYKTPQDEADEARIQERRRGRRQVRWVGISAAAVLLGIILVLVYQSVRKDWKIARLVKASHAAWERAPDKPDEAVAILRQAQDLSVSDERVAELREDLFRRGSLKVTTFPESEVEIVPEPAEDRELALPWKPKVHGSSRFPSGTTIRLDVGHYRMRFHVDGKTLEINEPIYVGHVKIARTAEGWAAERITDSSQVISHKPRAQDQSNYFYVASHVKTPEFLLLAEIPEGQVYVGPGWTLTTKDPLTATEFETYPDGDVQIHKSQAIHWELLETPFLADRAEVTVGAFRDWFERESKNFCEYRVERDSKFWIPYKETERLPLFIHRESWRAFLLEHGIDVDKLVKSRDILQAVFSKQLESRRGYWEAERIKIEEYLSKADDREPIGNVPQSFARAFARTYLPIREDELEHWLVSRIQETAQDAANLGQLRDWAKDRPADIRGKDVPRTYRFRCWWGCDPATAYEMPLKAYAESIRLWSYYAEQVPAQKVITWAKRHEYSATEIDALTRVLLEPTSWLRGTDLLPTDDIQARITTTLVIVQGYAKELGGDNALEEELIDRAHLEQWIAGRLKELEKRQRRFESLLDRLGSYEPETELSFRERFEYGDELGHDIPSPLHWDRMLGGDDSRLFPWGDDIRGYRCLSDRQYRRMPVETACGLRPDRSRYGILLLGGHQTEHVYFPNDDSEERARTFSKGTHSEQNADYASRKYFMSIPRGQAREFLGFRVIRKLNPLYRTYLEKSWRRAAKIPEQPKTREPETPAPEGG